MEVKVVFCVGELTFRTSYGSHFIHCNCVRIVNGVGSARAPIPAIYSIAINVALKSVKRNQTKDTITARGSQQETTDTTAAYNNNRKLCSCCCCFLPVVIFI